MGLPRLLHFMREDLCNKFHGIALVVANPSNSSGDLTTVMDLPTAQMMIG